MIISCIIVLLQTQATIMNANTDAIIAIEADILKCVVIQ